MFGIVYLVNALAPEMSPDGSTYHLPLVARYLSAHAFEPITSNLYASLSQGIELLFLPAFSLGGPSATAMVHFLFLLDLTLMMICYGRRFGFPVPAAVAAFLVFASPIVGWDGTSAYNDVAAAAILFALFYLLQIWDQERTAPPSHSDRYPGRRFLRREIHRRHRPAVCARLCRMETLARPKTAGPAHPHRFRPGRALHPALDDQERSLRR